MNLVTNICFKYSNLYPCQIQTNQTLTQWLVLQFYTVQIFIYLVNITFISFYVKKLKYKDGDITK